MSGIGNIMLMDGGFGTTLEDVFHKNINTPLWCATLTETDPETVIAAHLAFLEAGSLIIMTSTYQCAFETFERAGYGEGDAVTLMNKSVELASEAKSRFLARNPNITATDIKIALALGPYGATLTTAQEFSGYYPPPYGPQEFTPDLDATNTNAFSAEESEAEAVAVDSLASFHLRRLRVFCDHPSWDLVDVIIFETVPLVREIAAIRRAMGMLPEFAMKSWWVATVWPDGVFPQESVPGGKRLLAADVVDALVRDASPANPIPTGIGVNCTPIEFYSEIIRAHRNAFNTLLLSRVGDSEFARPWLILYPNGGVKYDPIAHVWLDSGVAHTGKAQWVKELVSLAKEEGKLGSWAGIVIGGCCKTAPDDIHALAEELNRN